MVSRLPEPESQAEYQTPSRPRRRLRVRKLPVSVYPTLLTVANALCGFMAVFFASRPTTGPDVAGLPFDWTPLTFAAMAVFAGMVFDGFDGRVARLTRSTSAFGEQLDSMADMVTFGVAPAFIAVQLVDAGAPFISDSADHLFGRAALAVALIYVACAALRLARYTVEARDKPAKNPSIFTGLPSPGAAGTIAALALLHQHALHVPEGQELEQARWLVEPARYAMVGITLLTALAMVSKLPYTHIMNRYLRGKAKVGTIAMYVVIALLLFIVPQWTLAIGFTGYALSAPLRWGISNIAPRKKSAISPRLDQN